MAGPAGGKFLVPRRGRAPRRYLSDKQRTPPSRGAEHVAKCGPELLNPNGQTPQMGQGDPAYVSRNTGRAGWHGELAPSGPRVSLLQNGSGLSSG